MVVLSASVLGFTDVQVGHAAAPSFVEPPTRLYMAPTGTNFATSPIPYVHPDVPIGTLNFDFTPDPISGDKRQIQVESQDDNCDHSNRPVPSYVGCTTVKLQVGNGKLSIPNSDTGNGIYTHADGADIDTGFSGAPGAIVYVRGEFDDVNKALADLVYDPDDDYFYNGNDPEQIEFDLLPGDPGLADLIGQFSAEIRVLDVNGWLDLTQTIDTEAVPSGGSVLIGGPDPMDASAVFDVVDDDNDDSTDTFDPKPPDCSPGDSGTHGSDCDDRTDGTGDDALLLMFTTCGGFEFLSTNGFTIKDDIEELLTDHIAANPASPTATESLVIAALLAAIETAAPQVTSFQLATNATNGPVTAFAGIAQLEEINYTLDNVTFHGVDPATPGPPHTAIANATCELFTIVSDLGNNGLPVEYLGDPPLGLEIPWPGVDFDSLTVKVGDGTTIDASLPAGPIDIPEGDGATVTVAITTDPTDPAGHPAFDLDITAVGTGGAVSAVDYDTVALTLTVPEDAVSVGIPISTIEDLLVDPGEGISLTVAPPATPPPGYAVTTDTATIAINIIDDDAAGVTLISVADPSVAEGDVGDTTLTFTLTLDNPATGNESVDVVTNDDSATSPADFDAVSTTVNFALGATTATVDVTVHGDTIDEGDHSFTLDLSNPVNLTIGDASGTGTILDDDGPSVVSIADATVTEGGIGNQTAISMTNFAGRTCAVTVASADGTATAPDDYAAIVGSFGIANTASDVLAISVANDADPEPAETFTITIALSGASDPQCALGDSEATITITDNDSGDVTPPTVTIDQGALQADPTSLSPIVFDVVFSEPVFGFTAADISFAGSTAPGVLVAAIVGSGPTYTVEVSGMTGDGTVVASIPGGSVIDANSNPNDASTSTDNSVSFELVDLTPPTVTIDQGGLQADPTGVSPIVFDVVFSEPVSGFVGSDVTLSGTAGATTALVAGTGAMYTVSVSGMTQDGTVIAAVDAGAAFDGGGNPSVASTSTDNQVTFDFDEGDVTPPTVTINQGGLQADPTGVSPIVFDVVFSEPVSGFVDSDVSLSGTAGPTTAVVAGTGTTYTVSVSGMTSAGTVIATVIAGAATDAANNLSLASTSTDNTVTYTQSGPTPIVLTLPANITKNNDPGMIGAVVTYPAPTATGGTPPISVSCSPASGAFFPIGTTTVTCTATDSNPGDQQNRFVEATTSGTFTVTVVDAEPPVIAKPPDLIRDSSNGKPIPVTFVTPSATDNAGPPVVTCAPASGSLFSLGVATVTCTATDAAGNKATTTFTVTVVSPASGVPITGSNPTTTLAIATALMLIGYLCLRPRRRRRLA